MENKFEIVDRETKKSYVSCDYDIFIYSNGVIEIFTPNEHIHPIVTLEVGEYKFYLL